MNERETERRREAFLAVLDRTFHYFPRAMVKEWGLAQFDLLSRGERDFRTVSDEALGAWTRTRRLWGHGWARGTEWRGGQL